MSTIVLVAKIFYLCVQSQMFPKQISGSGREKTGKRCWIHRYIRDMQKYHARSLLPKPNRTLKTDAITRDATGSDQPKSGVDNRRPGTGDGMGEATVGNGRSGVGGIAVLHGRATLRRCGISAKPERHQQAESEPGKSV